MDYEPGKSPITKVSPVVAQRAEGAVVKLDSDQRARLLSIARRDPPEGWTNWTMPLLAQELVTQGVVAEISPDEVRGELVKAIHGRQRRVDPTF